jgi:hypothetical protein
MTVSHPTFGVVVGYPSAKWLRYTGEAVFSLPECAEVGDIVVYWVCYI